MIYQLTSILLRGPLVMGSVARHTYLKLLSEGLTPSHLAPIIFFTATHQDTDILGIRAQ